MLGYHWGLYGALNRSYLGSLSEAIPVGCGGPFKTDGWGLEVGRN